MPLKGFSPATQMPDDVRWFDALGACRECPAPATGKLMGSRNESYGQYCRKCADKRLARAKLEREAVAEHNAAITRATGAVEIGEK
jgi:hypothetical protein